MFDTKVIKKHYLIAYRRVRNFLLSDRCREFLIFLFFVFVSTCFWFLQTMNDKYQAVFKIPVRLKDVPKEVVMTSEIPHEVRVKVEDRGTVLLNYMLGRTFFPIVFNFEEYRDKGGHVQIPVADVVRKITSQLNNSTRLVGIRPDTLEFIYSQGEAKKIPVAINGTISAGRQYYVSGTRVSPDSVTVYAPKDLLNSLTVAYTAPFVAKDLTDTMKIHVRLQKLRGVKFIPETADVTVCTDMYSEKTLEIPVVGLNFPPGKLLRTFPSKVQVTFQVGLKDFKAASPEDFFIGVSYEELLENKSDRIVLNIKKQPEYASHVRMNPTAVEYLIEQLPEEAKTDSIDD